MRARPKEAALDPRVERSRLVILQAAVAELGEAGYGAFTIESVAARAGVGKTTIYRHWSDKLALIADAFEALNEPLDPDIGDGTPRERLERLVRHFAAVVFDSTFSDCIPALVEASEHDPDARKFHHHYAARRRELLVRTIAEGIATGEFPADLDPELAALMLVGAIFYRRIMTKDRFPPKRAGELIGALVGKRAKKT